LIALKDQEVSIFLEESPPEKTEVSTAVLEMIKRAEKSIRIIQPYVTNVDELEDLLIEAARDRGVKVEIVTARIRDQPVYRTFLNADLFRRMFREAGPNLEIWEEPYKFLHMKGIVVDDGKYLTLGSLNQDTWSFYCNNEANVLLVNENAA
jgi:phosphatidylserine/phosphatidylglycerophosphate/cardiolipin synthase-like enzyme